MKFALIAREIDAPDLQWAVVLTNPDNPDDQSIVALFAYPDHAEQWAKHNYAGRFKIVRAVRA